VVAATAAGIAANRPRARFLNMVFLYMASD